MSLVKHSNDLESYSNRIQQFFLELLVLLSKNSLNIVFNGENIKMYSKKKLIYKLKRNVFDNTTAFNGAFVNTCKNNVIIRDLLNLLNKYNIYVCGVTSVVNKGEEYICFSHDEPDKYIDVFHLKGLELNDDTIRTNLIGMKSLWEDFEIENKEI